MPSEGLVSATSENQTTINVKTPKNIIDTSNRNKEWLIKMGKSGTINQSIN